MSRLIKGVLELGYKKTSSYFGNEYCKDLNGVCIYLFLDSLIYFVEDIDYLISPTKDITNKVMIENMRKAFAELEKDLEELNKCQHIEK